MGRYFAGVCLLMAAAFWGCSGIRSGKPWETSILSPDGQNSIRIERSGSGENRALTFAIARSGRTVVSPSAPEMILAGHGPLAKGSRLLDVHEDRLDESFMMPWGKSREVRNRCSLVRLSMESLEGIRWDLEFRAYDDGAAFRYLFPEQDDLRDFVLEEEATEFRLEGDPSVLFTSPPSFTSSHESPYRRRPYSELPAEALIDTPLLAVWPGGASAALTEARLRGFPGMYLERVADTEMPALRVRLSPLPSRPRACALGRTPFASPWRVVLLADKAGRHIESDLLICLNDPPEGDFSWLQPGKTTWHWWNGTAEEGLPFRSGMNFATHKHYIDFCARHGIAYHSVVADDRPWYRQSLAQFAPGPDTDILDPRPELEFPRILEYARRRGVGIRLWVHWQPLNERLEEAFTRYEEWGIKGLMVDFLDRNDQEMVEFCERVLDSAARHKLHIQFHGSYMPSGEQRTFPHLFNREGALNLEYLKWSDRCTPSHNVNVAYTRLLAGPLDYHLGGFRAVPPDRFRPRRAMPEVLGTRCHHLAMYVVYENPMPMVCDTPSSYEGQAGFEFLKEVPVTWDETRFLAGEAGGSVVVARRRERAWYLGGMTNDSGREMVFALDFLGPGAFQAVLYFDGSLSPDRPNAVRVERREVDAGMSLDVSMAPGGGFVAVVRPRSPNG